MSAQEGVYPANKRETIAEAPGLRVRMLALGEGQRVPWHYHNNITERIVCMEGPMQVKTRDPDAAHLLEPGQMYALAPRTVHYVSGVDHRPCMFISVQGVGEYDFVRVED